MNKEKKILYLYTVDEINTYSALLLNTLVRELKFRYEVNVCKNKQDYLAMKTKPTAEIHSYDIVFVQNSQSLIYYQSLLNKLKNTPLIFVSYSCDMNGYIAPTSNLYGVLRFDEANLTPWGIPQEMQTNLKIPVFKSSSSIQARTGKEYRILFYPDYYSVDTSCSTIISALEQFHNISLTIVSDSYQVLKSALSPNCTVIPTEKSLSALKKSHLIIASRHHAVQAMAYAKPCILLGDYGLGGMVTPDNYELMKSCDFRGRAGASFKELIPDELFQYEIQNALRTDHRDVILQIQERVVTDHNLEEFQKKIYEKTSHVIFVSERLKKRAKCMQLKPQCISSLATTEINDAIYLKSGAHFFYEIDKDLEGVLKQCDGKNTIQEIRSLNGYDEEETQILIDNLKELWNNKLIIFA